MAVREVNPETMGNLHLSREKQPSGLAEFESNPRSLVKRSFNKTQDLSQGFKPPVQFTFSPIKVKLNRTQFLTLK